MGPSLDFHQGWWCSGGKAQVQRRKTKNPSSFPCFPPSVVVFRGESTSPERTRRERKNGPPPSLDFHQGWWCSGGKAQVQRGKTKNPSSFPCFPPSVVVFRGESTSPERTRRERKNGPPPSLDFHQG